MPWVYDPHSGGVKIPKRTKESTEKRILTYAQKHYAGKRKEEGHILNLKYLGQIGDGY